MSRTVSRIDFGGRNYSAVAQDLHLEWAGNPNFPDYMRVVFVAYGRHAANGHAVLERGELAAYLVRKTGVIPDRRQVWKAMDHAVRLGYLREGSRLGCLVVNSDHVQGGPGVPGVRCRRDHKTHSQAAAPDRSDDGRFAENVGAGDRHSVTNVGAEGSRLGTNVGAEDRRFTLSPSLSSTHPTDRAAGTAQCRSTA